MASKKMQRSITSAASIGIALSVIITVILSMLTAIFISNEYWDININKIAAIVIQVVAAFAGSYLTNRLVPEGQGSGVIICASIYYVILLCISMLVYDGLSPTFWHGLISCAVGCILSFLLVNTTNNKHKNKKRTVRHR